MESIILLLPEPFGPDMVVNPFKKGMLTSFAKDLKLSTSSCFIYMPKFYNSPHLNYISLFDYKHSGMSKNLRFFYKKCVSYTINKTKTNYLSLVFDNLKMLLKKRII